MAFSLPPVIGHRGAAAHAPENTLAGFRAAARLGARWVELDVRLTADGRLAVIHDATLERTTGQRGRVGRWTMARLRTLDAGQGERIPDLEQALAEIARLGLGVNIELKAARGREDETAVACAVACAACPDLPPVLLSSFSGPLVAAAAARLPHLPRALVTGRMGRRELARAQASGAVSIHGDHRRLDAPTVAAAHEAGLLVAAYTVNDPKRAHALFAIGVDALFSDVPDRILPMAPKHANMV